MSDEKAFLPPEWEDDQKMTVLFAPFRERSLNPQSWDRKLKFWKHVINEDCRINNRLVIDIKSLPCRFSRKGKKPGCLEIVVAEMQRNGQLHYLSHYQKQTSNSWIRWGFDTFVRTPVSWGFQAMMGTQKDNSDQPLVVHLLLKEKCETLLESHYSSVEHESTDYLIELVVLKSQHASLCCTGEDFDLVLQQLQLEKKVIVTQTPERDTVVKFCKKNEKNVSPVAEIELNIFRIQKVTKNLEKQIEVLSSQCDRLTKEARSHVGQGKKTMALQSLRKRKRVEKTVMQKSASVDQLQNMMSKIQDAATNEMVLKAYDSGMNAIKTLNQETSVDKVESVMDNLQEALDDQAEISHLISRNVSSNDLSQDDLEDELEALLAADKKKEEEEGNSLAALMEGLDIRADTIPDLPEVPSFSPSKEGESPSRETTHKKPVPLHL